MANVARSFRIAAVALAVTAPAAWAEAVRATVTETPSGARIDFDFGGAAPPSLKAEAAAGGVMLRFSEPVDVDTTRMPAGAPRTIAFARKEADGATLRLTLRRTVTPSVQRSADGYRVILAGATPTAAPPPPSAASTAAEGPREIQVGQTKDFTRLTFSFPAPTTVAPLVSGDKLDLRFSRPASMDVARLNVFPPRFVKSARDTSSGGRFSMSMTLEPGTRQRHFVEGQRVIVDLLPPAATPPAATAKPYPTAAAPAAAAAQQKPAPPPVKAAPTDPAPGATLRVALADDSAATRIAVRWPAMARAAAFRRGDAVWIVFDSQAKLDISGLAKVGRRHRDLLALSGPGYTAVRLSAPPEVLLSAAQNGTVWTFTLADSIERQSVGAVARREVTPAGGRLVADFDREGVVRWITDPIVGDRIAVALLAGPAKGVDGRMSTLEASMLATAHGGALEPRADGVNVAMEGMRFVASRNQGLITGGARTAEAAAPTTPSLGAYGLLNLQNWSKPGASSPMKTLDELERAAAREGVEEGASATARLALARYLLSVELAPEALGAMRIAAINQPLLANDPEFRLMRAAANLMMGRGADARADLAAGDLAEDPSAALWRGYAAVQQENWAQARRELEAGRDALSTQTAPWRVRFRLALAEAALRQGDLAAAGASINEAMGEASRPDLQLQARLLRARHAAALGDTRNAMAEFDALAKAPDEAIAVRAVLEGVRLKRQLGKITPAAAADQLEALRYRWRGDSLELETIQTLGHTYADMGQWRKGLAVMAAASATFPNNPATRRMRIDMGAIFERLFIGGDADKLEPIQALGLFYEFKDLTPYGPDGDRLVRMLAGRLVKVDLLEQAAELLKHQVENRLEGIGQAQIALDLAAIYLDDKKADQALAILNETRQPGMPADLVAARRIVEATALLQLGRYDHAVEIVEKDRSLEAQRIRAESAWRRRDWVESQRTLMPLMPPPRSTAPLTSEERAIVLRAAIAAVFADDRPALASLERTYGARMQATPDGDAFEVVTSATDAGDARLREAARAIARTDLMDRFLKTTRERLSAPTPAGSPGSPAPGQAGPPAPAAVPAPRTAATPRPAAG